MTRFLYYIPGALAGAASVMVWLFMLDPTVSPAAPLLRLLGYGTFGLVIEPGHLAVLFAMIAFWTGAGGWIVVMYGALNNIPLDIIDAARIDGAGGWSIARRIQIPMLRKWIVYMVILAFAAGTQLFVEPQLISEASLGVAGRDFSLTSALLRLRVPEQQRQLRLCDLRRAARGVRGRGSPVRDPVEVLRCELTPPPRLRPGPPLPGARAAGLALCRARPAFPATWRQGCCSPPSCCSSSLPVLWLLLAATKTDPELVYRSPFSFGSWHALRENWDALTSFQGDTILLWLRNSTLQAFGALVITLLAGIPAGYALAMMEFRGRRVLLVVTLVVMLMPATTLVIPLFLELNAVHLIGTMWSVVLPYSFYPFGVYLTYIYFSTALPRDLLAAAKIDGCSEFGAFRRVALPLATPVVALVGFFSFVANWTNYFLPYVMLPESNQYPVQVGLGLLLTDVPQFNPTAGTAAVLRPELALATLLAISPVLIVFLFAQRFLVTGLLAGSTKE